MTTTGERPRREDNHDGRTTTTEGRPRREDDHDGTTTSGTPNHPREQLLAGWKRGAAEWQEDEGTRVREDEETGGRGDGRTRRRADEGTTTTTTPCHSTLNYRREQLLTGWKGGAM